MDEAVVLGAVIASSVSLLTVVITTVALRGVRKTQAIANLVEAHRKIAEDAVDAYERTKERRRTPPNETVLQQTVLRELDWMRMQLDKLSQQIHQPS